MPAAPALILEQRIPRVCGLALRRATTITSGGDVELLHDAGQHGRVVLLAQRRGYEDQPCLHVVQNECELAIAQRRQNRIHHHPRQRGGQIQDGRLVPIGQHEGHDAPGRCPGQHRLRQPSSLARAAFCSRGECRRRRAAPAAGSVLAAAWSASASVSRLHKPRRVGARGALRRSSESIDRRSVFGRCSSHRTWSTSGSR